MATVKPVVQKVGFNIYLDAMEYTSFQNLLYAALDDAKKEYADSLESDDEDTGEYEEKRVRELENLVKVFDSAWVDN